MGGQGLAMFRSYRDLEVWQGAVSLVESVYHATSGFPQDERFGLTSQIRRAAASVPSNIAEGHARSSTRDFLRHLSISRGSLAELETQLLISHRLGYLSSERMDALASECESVGRMLHGLTKALNARIALAPPKNST